MQLQAVWQPDPPAARAAPLAAAPRGPSTAWRIATLQSLLSAHLRGTGGSTVGRQYKAVTGQMHARAGQLDCRLSCGAATGCSAVSGCAPGEPS